MLHFSARRRSVAASMLVLIFAGTGCYTMRHQQPGLATSFDSATSVTTVTGTEISFARPGATMAHDTLVATGSFGELRIPKDSIAQVNWRGYTSGSSLVVIGAFAAAIAALLYVSVGYSTGGS